MNNLYHSIIVAALTAIAINYDLVRAQPVDASASASPAVVAEARIIKPYERRHSLNSFALIAFQEELQKDIDANPYIYDAADVEPLIHDRDAVYATKFFNQRSGNWKEAYRVAASTLKWRADMNIRHLNAQMFPCDLFSLGLIFEHGRTHHQDPTGAIASRNPVIWIRLGALGSIVKQMEKYTFDRITSFAVSTVRSMAGITRDFDAKSKIEDLSLKKERTVIHVLKSIAWWLEDWRNSHPPGTKATLVLDFEGADYVFSSTSTSDFFVKLDDRFPDFFEYIIGFRYKFNGKSLHSQVGWLNKIFSSRIKSSLETDRKLKFVNQEADIGAYMPRVDARGQSLLPAYISGGESLCMEASHTPPAGCQAELDTSNNLYDPRIWRAIHDEFNKVCKPQSCV